MSSRAECQLEFFDPQEKDWTGLEALLRHYLDGREWHCGELADTIIHQASSQVYAAPAAGVASAQQAETFEL